MLFLSKISKTSISTCCVLPPALSADVSAMVRRVRLSPDLPPGKLFLRDRAQRILFRRVERPPLHFRAQIARPPQRADRDLAHRRSDGAPARSDHEFYFRRSLGTFARRPRPHRKRAPGAVPFCRRLARRRQGNRETPPNDQDWTTLLAIREEVMKALDTARNEKMIGKPLEAQLTITRCRSRLLVAAALSGSVALFVYRLRRASEAEARATGPAAFTSK